MTAEPASAQPADFARSDDPVLDRLLTAASAQRFRGVDLTLDRIDRLLARMGTPHRKLPPVFHVAGTNGKGSTCAFLRAALEAAGHRVHVFTSPHLVRVNERIRLAGTLVSDAEFAEALATVLRVNAGQPLSFFEAITASAFLLFAATPADAVVLEVGLGGRLDATNVVPAPAATGIAQLALDHVQLLGPTLRHIAQEKAGIAKRGVPLLTQRYPAPIAAAIAEIALPRGARLMPRGEAWDASASDDGLIFQDGADPVTLPLPKLAGRHQQDNAALAVAMLRAQQAIAVPEAALRSAMGWAQWPGRLQRLHEGPLVAALPKACELWVDGGHNPAAARAVAGFAATAQPDLPLHLVAGMLKAKDHMAFLRAFPLGTRITLVPVPGHASLDPESFRGLAAAAGMTADTAPDLQSAMHRVSGPARVLVAGSLHLVGHALARSGAAPT